MHLFNIVFLSLLLIPGLSFADSDTDEAVAPGIDFAEPDWHLRREGEGIQVFSRKVIDSTIDAVKAEADIDAPIEKLEAILLDINRRREWDGMCSMAKNIDVENTSDRFAEVLYDMPWPVSDRDAAMRIDVQRSPGAVLISNTAVPNILPERKKAVRIQNASVSWQLTRISDETTHLVALVWLDPNGPIPGWLINQLSVSQPFDMVLKLRELGAAP